METGQGAVADGTTEPVLRGRGRGGPEPLHPGMQRTARGSPATASLQPVLEERLLAPEKVPERHQKTTTWKQALNAATNYRTFTTRHGFRTAPTDRAPAACPLGSPPAPGPLQRGRLGPCRQDSLGRRFPRPTVSLPGVAVGGCPPKCPCTGRPPHPPWAGGWPLFLSWL